jgi:hypothetical protein
MCSPSFLKAVGSEAIGLGMFFDNSSVRAILRTLPFAFRSTDRDDLIVDVHEKTTTVEVRILCNPPVKSLGNTVGSHGVCSAAGCQKNDGPLRAWARVHVIQVRRHEAVTAPCAKLQ